MALMAGKADKKGGGGGDGGERRVERRLRRCPRCPRCPRCGGSHRPSSLRCKAAVEAPCAQLDFTRRLSKELTPDQADALAAVLKPSAPSASPLSATSPGTLLLRWPWQPVRPPLTTRRVGGRRRALALVAVAEEAAGQAKHVYVLKFFGDIDGVPGQLVTPGGDSRPSLHLHRRPRPAGGARANTGGGTVTGYGLAAQLQRLKEAGRR